jgi:DNA-binding PadR family transcriptional regulator
LDHHRRADESLRHLARHARVDGLKDLGDDGALHGYGLARRIEQTSGNLLAINYGTLYPALLKLEQEGYIASQCNRSVVFS